MPPRPRSSRTSKRPSESPGAREPGLAASNSRASSSKRGSRRASPAWSAPLLSSASLSSWSTRARRSSSDPHSLSRMRARSAADRSRRESRSLSSRAQSSRSSIGPGLSRGLELGAEPGPRAHPSALGGAQGEPEGFRGLLFPEAAEEATLEDAGELGIALAQALQRPVDVEEPLRGRAFRGQPGLVELEGGLARAALDAQPRAGPVHENLPHHAGRHR